ncbi:MAG: crosslink repair DNA glycosylase YcaQ family protein [Chloroflexota bacterium]|nr:crosslink repair DNA glycosylase YcaQ family protein [Chloroflexota bacterium]
MRRLAEGRSAVTDEDAARYVDERGFAPLMHLSGCTLPSISEADERETWEGFDITDGAWRWKETLPEARRCAYGKFLRHRGFFVAWRVFPAFYRLYGPADDSAGADAFADGLLGRLEMLVLTAIADRGPIDSRRLWREVKQGFGGNRTRFEQALGVLQAGFRVMVAGGDLTGWSLHRWDLLERLVPPGLLDDLPSREESQIALLRQYVENTVVCTPREIAGFFRCGLKGTQALVDREMEAAHLRQVEVEGWKGIWLSTAI